MDSLERIALALESFIDWIGRATSWLVLGMVLLISGEVIFRYGFDKSSIAAQDLEWWLLAVISLFGLSYTLKHGEHVRVDVLYQFYGETFRLWFDFLIALFVMTPVAFYIADLSVPFLVQSWDQNEASVNPGGLPDLWFLKGFVPAGFFLLGLQCLALAAKHGIALRRHYRRADGKTASPGTAP
jgi:TRAP-type mannitol/chloroaromatic compound transport system permease small subunit